MNGYNVSKDNKNKLKMILIIMVILLIGIIGYLMFIKHMEQLEAQRIDVVFVNDSTEYELGTELKDLVIVNKADQIEVKLINDSGKEINLPKPNELYTAVFTCHSADNVKVISKNITFVDTIAPVIEGVNESINLEYGEKVDLLENVKALDYSGNVDLQVNGVVDSQTPGEYFITYVATDSSGNQSSVVTKVVVNAPLFSTY